MDENDVHTQQRKTNSEKKAPTRSTVQKYTSVALILWPIKESSISVARAESTFCSQCRAKVALRGGPRERPVCSPFHHLGTRTLQKEKLCGRGRKESRKGRERYFRLGRPRGNRKFLFWGRAGISWTGFSRAPNWVTDPGGVSREEKS